MSFYDSYFAILLAAGVLIAYVTLRREMQSQIAELRKLISEAKGTPAATPPPFVPIAVASPTPAAAPSKIELVKKEPAAVPVAAAPKPVKEEITAEILAVIAAAVAQFVGAGARIRSTRVIPITESNAWAQQGRVIVQASHNLGMR